MSFNNSKTFLSPTKAQIFHQQNSESPPSSSPRPQTHNLQVISSPRQTTTTSHQYKKITMISPKTQTINYADDGYDIRHVSSTAYKAIKFFKHDDQIFLRYKARSLERCQVNDDSDDDNNHKNTSSNTNNKGNNAKNNPTLPAFMNLTHSQQLQHMALKVFNPKVQYNLQRKIASLNPPEEDMNPAHASSWMSSNQFKQRLLTSTTTHDTTKSKQREQISTAFTSTFHTSPRQSGSVKQKFRNIFQDTNRTTATAVSTSLQSPNYFLPSIMEQVPYYQNHNQSSDFMTQPISSPDVKKSFPQSQGMKQRLQSSYSEKKKDPNSSILIDFTTLKDRLSNFTARKKKRNHQFTCSGGGDSSFIESSLMTNHTLGGGIGEGSDDQVRGSIDSTMMNSISTEHSMMAAFKNQQNLFHRMKLECQMSVTDAAKNLAKGDKKYRQLHQKVIRKLEGNNSSLKVVDNLKNIVEVGQNYESAAELVSRCESEHTELHSMSKTFNEQISKLEQSQEILTCRARINHIRSGSDHGGGGQSYSDHELVEDREDKEEVDEEDVMLTLGLDKETALKEREEYISEITRLRTSKEPLQRLDERPKLLRNLLKIRRMRINEQKDISHQMLSSIENNKTTRH